MENIKLFENQELGCKVRTLTIDGKTWFVGKDVCDALEYVNSRKAIIDNVKANHKKHMTYKELSGVTAGDPWSHYGTTLIDEAGLYSLIMKSKMQKAEEFQEWVTEVVLPELRKAAGLDESDAFRMLEKQCQRKATDKLKEMNATKVDYCKTYAIANKAVSTLYGFDKSLKKNEMTEDMLVDRIPILNVTADLMLAKDKGLIKSVSDSVYSLFIH